MLKHRWWWQWKENIRVFLGVDLLVRYEDMVGRRARVVVIEGVVDGRQWRERVEGVVDGG